MRDKLISIGLSLQALVTIAPAAFGDANKTDLAGVMVSEASISTADGGRAEAQRRILKDGSTSSVLTQYNKSGTIVKRLVCYEAKDVSEQKSAPSSHTNLQTRLAASH